MTAVRLLDYGVGNMHSIKKALERTGLAVETVPAAEGPGNADGIVLPGVGAFEPAARALAPVREALADAVRDGTPLLGVCLGMQLLAEASVEGNGQGLGLVPGTVKRLEAPRIPHIGWNTVDDVRDPLLSPLDGGHVYYVHSFALDAETPGTVATTTYGAPFAAVVRRDNLLAAQFHPEKSSAQGRLVLDVFKDLVEGAA